MEAIEGFEITDFPFVIRLTEPITKELIDTSYDLLLLVYNCLSNSATCSISFNQMCTSLNVIPERLLNTIYILKMRHYLMVFSNNANKLVIKLTDNGTTLAKVLLHAKGFAYFK